MLKSFVAKDQSYIFRLSSTFKRVILSAIFTSLIIVSVVTTNAQTGELTVTAPGSYQSELGCEPQMFDGDWEPACTLTQLTDPDGDDIYTWSSNEIPAGDWEVKIAIDYSWDENYGANGERDGDNIPFSVQAGQQVTFSYNASTQLLTINVGDDEPFESTTSSTNASSDILSGYPIQDEPGDNGTQIAETGGTVFTIELASDNSGNLNIDNGWVEVLITSRAGSEFSGWIPESALSGDNTPSEQEVSLPEPVDDVASLIQITTGNVAQLEERLPLSRGTISSVAHSPIDNILAVASATGLYLFDSSDLSADPVHVGDSYDAIGGNQFIPDIVYSPDGTKIAYANVNGVHIYNLETGNTRQLQGISNLEFIHDMAFDDTGLQLITAVQILRAGRRSIQFIQWDASSGQQLNVVDNENIGGYPILIHNDKAIFTRFGNIEVWNFETEEQIASIENNYDETVWDMDYAPQAGLLVTRQNIRLSALDSVSVVRLWDTNAGELISELISQNQGLRVGDVQFLPDETQILLDSNYAENNTYRIWDIETQTFIRTLNRDVFGEVIFTDNDSGIIFSSYTGEISSVEFTDNVVEVIDTVQAFNYRANQSQFTHDGRQLLVAFSNGLHVFDTDSLQLQGTIEGSSGG